MGRVASLLWIAIGAFTLTSCRTYRQNEVVQETYIHKYGVPVEREDWKRNGKDGQVVTLKNDGVTTTKTYEKGTLHGKTTLTFPNSSTVKMIETYDQGVLVTRVENYPSGIAKQQEKFQGNLLAELNGWYEDGTPASHERHENGLIVSGEYRTPLNEIETKVEEGKGIRVAFTTEGELLYKDKIEGGQMVERIAYFQSGEPSSISPYKEGKIHGTRLTFVRGGLPNTVEEWVSGEQDGITVVYHNGEKIAEMPYVKGKKEGIERRFRDGSVVAEEVSWKNDLQHGPRNILLEDSQTKTEWYHRGEVVSRTVYERLNFIR